MAQRLNILIFLIIAFKSAWAQSYQVQSQQKAWADEVEALLADSLAEEPWQWRLQTAGFWLYQLDSNRLKTGPKLKVGQLTYDDYQSIAGALSLNDSNFRLSLKQELEKVENKGYPFARFELLDYRISQTRLDAHLKLQKGPLIRFDSLVILANDGSSRRFIEREIDWRSGRRYSKKYLEELAANLNRLEFLQLQRAPAVAFFPGTARLYLYLKKRNANLINGVVGLNTDDDGNSQLTGDFQLRLLNIFKRGEEIKLQWRSPGEQSQDFQLGLSLPYLWNSPFGLKLEADLFRQDTSFLRRDFKLTLPYRLAAGSHFKLSSQYFASSPLGDQEESRLKVQAVSSLRFNLGFDLDRRNDRIVSSRGYFVDLELGSGQRQIEGARNLQYLWQGQFQYYQPFFKRWVWHQEFVSEGMTGRDLQDNEIFRLGGLNSLRGFNEWSFFSPAYALMRSEVRYMLGPYDYLTAFADLAFNEGDRSLNRPWDRHSGLGLGLNFQTKGGIFSLFLAVGQSNQSPYDFRAGKIHLAYVNRF